MSIGTSRRSDFSTSFGRQSLVRRPGIGCPFDGLIVSVEGWCEEEDCGDAAGDVHYFTGFVGCEGAAEEFVLAVAEPFLDYLIAADCVVPNARRNVSPVATSFR